MFLNFEAGFQTEPCHGKSISAKARITCKKMISNRLVRTRMLGRVGLEAPHTA